jgi:NAD(P)H-hydrate epimerase
MPASILKTQQLSDIKSFASQLFIPSNDSHKGQNGKVLIVGGSELFHAASLWAAEICSHFADMVHFASTDDNNKIFQHLKTVFRNGIVVPRQYIDEYIKEDDAVLIGPGLVRGEAKAQYSQEQVEKVDLEKILNSQDEPDVTKGLVHYLTHTYPDKKFVIDAGALQMMDPEWLLNLKTTPILTPHQIEFQTLFGIDLKDKPLEEKSQIVTEVAAKYKSIILMKAVDDIISDGTHTYIVQGGNQGLTKGGSGDILAGFTSALYAKNEPLVSAVIASYTLKRAGDALSESYGYWYNMEQLIDKIPTIFKLLTL